MEKLVSTLRKAPQGCEGLFVVTTFKRTAVTTVCAAAETANPAQIPANNSDHVNLVKNFDIVPTLIYWILALPWVGQRRPGRAFSAFKPEFLLSVIARPLS
jgi:hypothetical protein